MASSVGLIGLGRMGLPMASSLARGGKKVVAFDRSGEAMERASKIDGVKLAASPGEVAAKVGVLFTALPNNEIVRAVYLDEGGIASGGKAGLVTCDCSTVSPEVTQALHAALGKQGIHHMDTPMLGSTPQAAEGQIFFIVGGDKQHLPKIAPYLELMGKAHHYVGASGTGNWVKLMHNVLAAVNAAAVSETLAVCLKVGIPIQEFYHVVVNGGGQGYSTYFNSRVMRMALGNFDPTFTLELMNKDVNLAVEVSEPMGGPIEIMKATQREFNRAVQNKAWAKEDFSAVTHLMEKQIGKKIVGA
jgi:3-hydroxyisobutyrate dehydrogenase-like beta-hydroxyacid dehydrogenase